MVETIIDPNAQEAIKNSQDKAKERQMLLSMRADILGKMAELKALSEDKYLMEEKIIAVPSGVVNPQTGQPTMVPVTPKELYENMYPEMVKAFDETTIKLGALTESGLILL